MIHVKFLYDSQTTTLEPLIENLEMINKNGFFISVEHIELDMPMLEFEDTSKIEGIDKILYFLLNKELKEEPRRNRFHDDSKKEEPEVNEELDEDDFSRVHTQYILSGISDQPSVDITSHILNSSPYDSR